MKTAIQETPMQELLKEIVECRNIETDLLLPFIKSKIISKLPKEQEAIEQAYIQGQMSIDEMDSGASCITKSAEDYYQETYKS